MHAHMHMPTWRARACVCACPLLDEDVGFYILCVRTQRVCTHVRVCGRGWWVRAQVGGLRAPRTLHCLISASMLPIGSTALMDWSTICLACAPQRVSEAVG